MEWPFRVELLPLDRLMVDLRYQRPPQEVFVARLIEQFDETLVGVLDISARKNGADAILDGAQRYQALMKHKTTAWCAIYENMSLADEALFFYNKNKNRRSVHPYYQFRALLVTGDKAMEDIDRIVKSENYKLGIGAREDHVITAIRATEDAYKMSSLARPESLSPALRVMRAAFFGRKGGKEGEIIRGFGKFFQNFEDDMIDLPWLVDKMAGQNPLTLLGRADDKASTTRFNRAYWFAKDVVDIYNRGKRAGHRLSPRMITG
jgi:Family of unknown function (DUF6551)